MTPPIIILVNPQMGENIGATARAMMNFGLRELRLVAPRDGWPNEKAHEMAAHGKPIIEAATVYETLSEASADLHYLYASTARDRQLRKPQHTPREASAQMRAKTISGEKVGLLLGPERTGLENEDIAMCQALVTIPCDPDHSSINIAQAAVLLAYEWWQSGEDDLPLPIENEDEPAPQKDIHSFFEFLEDELEKTYFFKVEARKRLMWQNLRTTLLKADFNKSEWHTLRGMVSALVRGDKRQ